MAPWSTAKSRNQRRDSRARSCFAKNTELLTNHGQLPEVAPSWFVATGFFQGVLAASLTVYCYAQSVRLLGASRAALLPAMMPPVALILGAIALKEMPGWLEIAAVTVTLIGFGGAVGIPLIRQPHGREIEGNSL